MKYSKRLSALTFIVAFVVTLVTAQAANAATYYVSSSYTGSTSNGGINTPWKTLSQVQNMVGSFQPGDNILFKKGDTFIGQLGWQYTSGTASAPITLGSYGTGAKPVFQYPIPSPLPSNWSWWNVAAGRVLMWFSGVQYIVIDGLSFTDPTMPLSDKRTPANLGTALQLGEFGGQQADHMTVKNSDFSNASFPIVLNGSFGLIDNNRMTDHKNMVSTNICAANGPECTTRSWGDDDDYAANAITLSGNDNVVTRNYISGAWAPSLDYAWNGGALEAYATQAIGFSRNKIMYNTFVDNGGVMEFGSSNGTAAVAADNLFAYNLLVNNGNMSWTNFGGTYPTINSNIQYFNNVIVENSASRFSGPNACNGAAYPLGSRCGAEFGLFLFGGSASTSNVYNLKNNIFYLSTGINVRGSGNESKYIHENNVYRLSGGSAPGWNLNASEKTTTSTLFTNIAPTDPTQWNYNLVAGVPAINAGTNVGITSDFAGVTVPQGGAPDAGIYEFVSGGTADTTAPTVSVSSPTNGASVSGTTTITANASDNTAVVGVQFKVDGANVGSEDVSAPYTTPWTTTGVTNGSHTVTAVARDAAGNTATATNTVSVNNVVPDTTAPTVSFSSPAAGATVSGTTSVSATASDNIAVTSVEFKLDGTTHSTDTSAPYAATWITTGVTDGSHTWTVTARDAAGNASSATRSFNVSNITTPSVPTGLSATSPAPTQVSLSWSASSGSPTGYKVYRNNVNIGTVSTASFVDTTVTASTTYTYKVSAYNGAGESTLSSGSTVTTMQNTNTNPTVPTGLTSTSSGTQVTITWIASTGSLTGYKVYRNGALVGQTTGATSYSGTVSAGTYSYTVSAFNASFESAQSIPVVVTIGNQADVTAPVVALTSPTNGQAVTGSMTLAATATDAVGVVGVLFRIDGVQYGSEDTTMPYMISVDSIALSNGTHTVTATARDAAGNSSVASSAITVTNTGALMYKTTARVNVRFNPTTWIGGTILGTQPLGAIGTVIPGTTTVNANGYTWVKLDFPTGADGWVVTRYLTVYNGSQTGKIVTPTDVATPVPIKLVDAPDTTMRAMELLQQASRVSTSAEANRLIAEAQALMKR